MKLNFEKKSLGTRIGATLGQFAILVELVAAAGGDALGEASGIITMHGFKVGISIVGWWLAALCVGYAVDQIVSGVRERRFDFALCRRIVLCVIAIAGIVYVRVAFHPVGGRVISNTTTSVDVYNGRPFDDSPTMTIKGYVDEIRAAAVKKVDPDECDPIRGDDLSASATSYNFVREFELVYVDASYVSFRTYVVNYYGGAGNHSRVFVGTIDRKSGRVLGVADFVPKSKWPALKLKLHDGADKELRKRQRDPAHHVSGWTFDEKRDKVVDMLAGEVEVIENFYYAKDGLHFIYNPYEIACGAMGDVEVVIDPKTL